MKQSRDIHFQSVQQTRRKKGFDRFQGFGSVRVFRVGLLHAFAPSQRFLHDANTRILRLQGKGIDRSPDKIGHCRQYGQRIIGG